MNKHAQKQDLLSPVNGESLESIRSSRDNYLKRTLELESRIYSIGISLGIIFGLFTITNGIYCEGYDGDCYRVPVDWTLFRATLIVSFVGFVIARYGTE